MTLLKNNLERKYLRKLIIKKKQKPNNKIFREKNNNPKIDDFKYIYTKQF